MSGTLQKYRIIKQPGKPVGPHVDFARDEQGNILRGPSYRDEQGRQMPGDPIERLYYPGDEVWSEADLEKEFNGLEPGLCKKKFEKVSGVQSLPSTEMEEFLEWKAAKAKAAGSAPVTATSEDPAKAAKVNTQQRMSPEALNAKSFKELVDLAKAEGVDLKGASKKEDLVKILLAALNV